MALNPLMLERLVGLIKPGQSIASLGYPDILCPPDKLRDLLGDKVLQLKYRPESETICKRHFMEQQDIPDAESFFEALGCTLDVFDIVQERGCEIVLDLNLPIPENACGQFDYVLDVGTLEHCFNAPQALMNMAALCKVGGYVMHENPFNWGNHGFWNVNPTLFHDFYTDNGFEVKGFALVDHFGGKVYECPATQRFKFTNAEGNILTVVRKVEEVEFKMPVQSKYRKKNEDSRKDCDGSAHAGG